MSVSANIPAGCFDNLIAIRDMCDNPESHSGLFIEDAGVSIHELNELVTREYRNGVDLFNKKLAFSISSVSSKVHTYLSPKYLANSVLENSRVGIFQDNLKMISGELDKLRGIHFELVDSTSYLEMFVSEISVQTNYSGKIDISVIDLTQGKLIDTIPIDSVADEISAVFVNKTYRSNRRKLNLLFAYDTSSINSNTTYLNRNANCAGCSPRNRILNQYMRITPCQIDKSGPFINENLTGRTDTAGLSIVYSLNCNHRDWLCSVSNVIAIPVLWKTAAEIMQHGMLNSPNEQMTSRTINMDLLEKRFAVYDQNFRESFSEMMSNIVLPSDEKCFVCKGKIKHAIMIP